MYPKLKTFQPELITKSHFTSFTNPDVINQGRCWQWAYLAHKTFQGVELWDICEHAFVRYQNKFYDCQRLLGEEDWRDLPASNLGSYQQCPECEACGREPEGAIPLTVKQFQYHWNSQTKRYNITWKDLDRMAQQYLSSL
jgi:hypothetical protein